MKKITLLFLLLIYFTTYSQTSTEKYNSYLNRYEYFDNQGNLTGYKQYNSYLKQWEYFKVPNQNYQPQSSLNVNLAREVLNSKQEKYDLNFSRLKNKVKQIFRNIDYIVLEFDRDDVPEELDYKYAEHLKYLFQNQYVKIVEQNGYDYSNNSVTENVISYLENGSIEIITKEFEFYKEVSNDYYYKKVNKYKSLF